MLLRVVARIMVIELLRCAALARNAVRSGLAMLGIPVAIAIVITVIALGRASIAASEVERDRRHLPWAWVPASAAASDV